MKRFRFLSPNEEQAIKEFCRDLKGKYKHRVKFIRMFGSKVRGKGDRFSDIDMLILLDRKDNRIKDYISQIAWEMSLKWDVIISPIVYEEHIFQRPAVQITPFIKNVLREGILI